jgi:hypothetical protein
VTQNICRNTTRYLSAVLPATLAEDLEFFSKQTGLNKSVILRLALKAFLAAAPSTTK